MSDKDYDRIGDLYQEKTKYSRNRMAGGKRPGRRPDPFKKYDGAEKVSMSLEGLPEGSLWQALQNRRSRRTFTGEAIPRDDLAKLVWSAQGATANAGGILLRTSPSAGALYPVETYVVVNAVKDVKPGLHHFNIAENVLELVEGGNQGKALARAALEQEMCARASVCFVWTAIVDRCKWKYSQRAYRYIYMDAGHVCGNLYLAAQDLGYGCCAIGAFFDEEVDELLGVDGESETAIYIAAAGPVKEKMD